MSRAARVAVEQRARLLELLGRLSPAVLEDLDRRARFVAVPDGFGSVTGGGGARGSEVSRPVEAAVVARGERVVADPVGEQIRNLFAALSEAAGVLGPAGRWLDYLQAYGDREAVRESSLQGDCGACGRAVAGSPQDRLRSGYCSSCHQAWLRAGYPERPGFERERLAKVGAKVERPRAVPSGAVCAHACCSRVVEHEHWHPPSSCPDCTGVGVRESVLAPRSEAS